MVGGIKMKSNKSKYLVEIGDYLVLSGIGAFLIVLGLFLFVIAGILAAFITNFLVEIFAISMLMIGIGIFLISGVTLSRNGKRRI
jgi:hypothetical protein